MISRKMKLILQFLAVSLGMGFVNSSLAEDGFSAYVDEDGTIGFPEDFRRSMAHLGSWYVPEGGASGFHDVYASDETVDQYRKTGEFPDGAVLVKELRASESGNYTTGSDVSFATSEIKQWFVMIRDREGRFESNPVWGEGWGWALFSADDTTVNKATDYKTDCLGCHVPAKDNDWVYIEAYPTLSKD